MTQTTLDTDELLLPESLDQDSASTSSLPAVQVPESSGTKPATTLAENSPMAVAMAAARSGMTPDQIREMMDLQDRWEAREAKKACDAAFAAFKAEGVRLIKGKTRSDGPLKGQKYAELHDIVNAVTPALSRYGLSCSWRTTRDEKDWIEITCYLRHTAGHVESVAMGGPPDKGPGRNEIQARASTVTYLERYTLKAILGLAEEGDDRDGESEINMLDWRAKVDGAEDLDALRSIKQEGVKFFTKAKDVPGYQQFMAQINARLKKLEGEKDA